MTQLVKEKNQMGELLQQLSDVFHGLSDTLEAGALPGVGLNQEQLYSLSDVAALDVRRACFSPTSPSLSRSPSSPLVYPTTNP